MNPEVELVLFVAGILGVYAETVWPGRYVPGLTGVAAVVVALYFVAHRQTHREAFALLLAAAALFAAEAFWRPDYVYGSFATAVLTVSLYQLFTDAHAIAPPFKILAGLVVGSVTLYFVSAAKRSRRSKRADLGSTA